MRTTRFLAALPIVLLIGGCSGSDTSSSEPEATEQRALAMRIAAREELTMEGAIIDAAASVPASNSADFARPITTLLKEWAALVPKACTKETALRDVDQDGVGVGYTIDFNCTESSPSNLSRLLVSGRVIVDDNDDSAADSGFRVTFENFKITHESAGGRAYSTRALDGTIEVIGYGGPPQTANGFEMKRDLLLTIAERYTNAVEVEGSYATRLDGSYLPPIEAAQPFERGAVLFRGTSQGMLSVNSPTGAPDLRVAFSLERQTTPVLNWNRACKIDYPNAPAFDGGGIIQRDTFGGMVLTLFKGCGEWDTQYAVTPPA